MNVNNMPPPVRTFVQVAIVAALIFTVWSIRGLESDRDDDRARTETVEGVLAGACGAASFRELRSQGLVEECRLAQTGDLGEAVPEADLEDPPDDGDVLPDAGDTDPSDVLPPSNTNGLVKAAVFEYLDENPLPVTPGYENAIGRSVAAYLTENPPEPGRPPNPGEIRSAVRDALLANPPEDGADGLPGIGVVATTLDGCDVVFSYTDGSTERVGPLCGPAGASADPPSDEQIAAQVAAYCAANGDCRGPSGVVTVADDCNPPDGEVLTNVDPEYNAETGTFRLVCESKPSLLP